MLGRLDETEVSISAGNSNGTRKRLTGTVTKPSETLLMMMLTVYRTLKANIMRVSRRFSLGGGGDPARMRAMLPIEPQKAWIAERV
jgi:hypothetical protein